MRARTRKNAAASSIYTSSSSSSSAVRPVPAKPRKPSPTSSSAVRPRMERENRSPVLWIVLGGIILLVGIGSWIWLGRTPVPDIPQPTTEIPVAPAVVAPPPAPVPETPVVEEKPEPEPAEPVADESPKESKTQSAKTAKQDPKKIDKPLPPPPPPEPDPADKKTEKVFVTSRPSGAKVVLDGRSIGKTPLEVEIKGTGKLSLSLEGYKNLDKTVRVADVKGTLNLVLEAEAASAPPAAASGPVGKFFLSSSPAGAEIRADGKLIGKTPRMVELPVGSHKLELKSGALEKSIEVDLSEGANPAKHVPL